MKKIISLILCMVMVFLLMPVVSVSAGEYDGYTRIAPDTIYDVYLYEGNGYEYYCYTPMKTTTYNIYSIDTEDTFIYIYDEFGNEIAYDDDSGIENNFSVFLTLEANVTYSFVISSYFDAYSYFEFVMETFDKEEFGKIELDETHTVMLSASTIRELVEFTPDEDGYYAFYSYDIDNELYDNPYALLYDSNLNVVDWDNDSGEGNNFSLSCYLSKGDTYYFVASRERGLWDMSYKVGIKKTTVAVKTRIVKEPDNMQYFEGYVEENIDYSGLELELTYSDGSKLIWKYDEQTEIVGTGIDVMLLKDEGGKYFIYIIAGFSDCRIYIDVVKNEVESISVYSMPKIELYENISGYKDYDKSIYYYNFIYTYEIPKDTLMKIDYTDGSSKIVNFYDKVNNADFTYRDNQLAGHLWSLGENPITIEFCSKQTTIYAEVVKNPVEKLTLNSAPTKKYVYGNGAYGGSSNGNYEFHPDDMTGLSFNVHYNDGTVRTYTDEDIVNRRIDGYVFEVDWLTIPKGGTYQATFRYFEKELKFDVFVYDKIEPKGDIDMDGKVSVMDATLIQMHLADMVQLNEAQVYACNVFFDGTTNISDVTHLQRYIAKIITKL